MRTLQLVSASIRKLTAADERHAIAYAFICGSLFSSSARAETSASKTINFVEAFGHVDAYFEGSHRQNLDQPILAWLERVVSHQ